MLRGSRSLGPSLGLACGLVLTPLPALSQQVSMVGTWKGPAHAVQIGSSPYRPVTGTGVTFPDNAIEFTLVIKEQHDNRFAGESVAANIRETIIGALQPDNRGGIILDNDGQYTFALIDPDTIDVCYSHLYPSSKLAACYRLTRSR